MRRILLILMLFLLFMCGCKQEEEKDYNVKLFNDYEEVTKVVIVKDDGDSKYIIKEEELNAFLTLIDSLVGERVFISTYKVSGDTYEFYLGNKYVIISDDYCKIDKEIYEIEFNFSELIKDFNCVDKKDILTFNLVYEEDVLSDNITRIIITKDVEEHVITDKNQISNFNIQLSAITCSLVDININDYLYSVVFNLDDNSYEILVYNSDYFSINGEMYQVFEIDLSFINKYYDNGVDVLKISDSYSFLTNMQVTICNYETETEHKYILKTYDKVKTFIEKINEVTYYEVGNYDNTKTLYTITFGDLNAIVYENNYFKMNDKYYYTANGFDFVGEYNEDNVDEVSTGFLPWV